MQRYIPGSVFYRMKGVILLSNLHSLSIVEGYIMSYGISSVQVYVMSVLTH